MLYKMDFEGPFEYLMESAEAFKTPNIIFQPYIMFGTKINQHSFWPKKFKLWTLILDWEWITHFCPLCSMSTKLFPFKPITRLLYGYLFHNFPSGCRAKRGSRESVYNWLIAVSRVFLTLRKRDKGQSRFLSIFLYKLS